MHKYLFFIFSFFILCNCDNKWTVNSFYVLCFLISVLSILACIYMYIALCNPWLLNSFCYCVVHAASSLISFRLSVHLIWPQATGVYFFESHKCVSLRLLTYSEMVSLSDTVWLHNKVCAWQNNSTCWWSFTSTDNEWWWANFLQWSAPWWGG